MLKISEHHIEKIFQIIVDSHSPVVRAAFMSTLQAMAKVHIYVILGNRYSVIPTHS